MPQHPTRPEIRFGVILPPRPKKKRRVQRHSVERLVRLRRVLKLIHDAAVYEAADVMTHPTWSLDYMFKFKLTVKELREIHAYLNAR